MDTPDLEMVVNQVAQSVDSKTRIELDILAICVVNHCQGKVAGVLIW